MKKIQFVQIIFWPASQIQYETDALCDHQNVLYLGVQKMLLKILAWCNTIEKRTANEDSSKSKKNITWLIKKDQVQNISINFTDCIYNKNFE